MEVRNMRIGSISGDQPYAQTEGLSPAEGMPAPEKEKVSGEKSETTTINTDQVDREIERLKQKKQSLEQQIRAAQNEQQREALERELRMIESALSFKDNDTYRKQNAIMI